jgi:hypothetical protein
MLADRSHVVFPLLCHLGTEVNIVAQKWSRQIQRGMLIVTTAMSGWESRWPHAGFLPFSLASDTVQYSIQHRTVRRRISNDLMMETAPSPGRRALSFTMTFADAQRIDKYHQMEKDRIGKLRVDLWSTLRLTTSNIPPHPRMERPPR